MPRSGRWHAARTDRNWLEKAQQPGPRMGSSSANLKLTFHLDHSAGADQAERRARVGARTPRSERCRQCVSYRFQLRYFSHKLLSSLYPPNTILLRRNRFSVMDKGHTEAWDVNGPIPADHRRPTNEIDRYWVFGDEHFLCITSVDHAG